MSNGLNTQDRKSTLRNRSRQICLLSLCYDKHRKARIGWQAGYMVLAVAKLFARPKHSLPHWKQSSQSHHSFRFEFAGPTRKRGVAEDVCCPSEASRLALQDICVEQRKRSRNSWFLRKPRRYATRISTRSPQQGTCSCGLASHFTTSSLYAPVYWI